MLTTQEQVRDLGERLKNISFLHGTAIDLLTKMKENSTALVRDMDNGMYMDIVATVVHDIKQTQMRLIAALDQALGY